MTKHFVGFWNLENLFAPEGYPQRVAWLAKKMAKDLKGWNQALFDTKIQQLGSIIIQMNNGNGPDLLGVCEVENAYVLDELTKHLNGLLPKRNYGVVHVDSKKDQRGIDTAFICDKKMYKVDSKTVFSHFVMRRTGTRDITQATFKTKSGNDIIAFCNHWPSRSGGAYESRGFRMTAGETLAYWLERIWEETSNEALVIAFGDFNDDPFDESLVIHAGATKERGDVERSKTAASFYNLAWRYLNQHCKDWKGKDKLLQGTLYFKGNGNVFDQILISKGLLNKKNHIVVNEATARIEAYPEMVDHKVSWGAIRFGLPKGNVAKNINASGFSDHFPVSVVLEEK